MGQNLCEPAPFLISNVVVFSRAHFARRAAQKYSFMVKNARSAFFTMNEYINTKASTAGASAFLTIYNRDFDLAQAVENTQQPVVDLGGVVHGIVAGRQMRHPFAVLD